MKSKISALPLLVFSLLVLTDSVSAKQQANNPLASESVTRQELGDNTSKETSLTDLARQQFEFQKEIEKEKLRIEQNKAWLTGGSILIPLLIGIAGIYWQVNTAFKLKAKELDSAQALKEREAKTAFELKAVEIVLNSSSPRAGQSKAELLQQFFPDRLPADFADKLKDKLWIKPGTQRGITFEDKVDLLQMLVDKIGHEDEVIRLWRIVNPQYQQWFDQRFPSTAEKQTNEKKEPQSDDPVP